MVGRSRITARMDVDVAAGRTCFENERDCQTCSLECWSFHFKLFLKTPSWNVLGRKEDVTDLDMTRMSMLKAWDTTKIGLSGVHELFTPRKMRCPARSRSQRRVDTLKLLESELTDCSRETWSDSCIRRWVVALGVE